MKKILSIIFAFVLAINTAQAVEWTGNWDTNYGQLRLIENGDVLYGDYGDRGVIVGKFNNKGKRNIEGWFINSDKVGTFRFGKTRQEKFSGTWKWADGGKATIWKGTRTATRPGAITGFGQGRSSAAGFKGEWNTNFGKVKLSVRGPRVIGFYRDIGIIYGSVDRGVLKAKFTNGAKAGVVHWRLLDGKLDGQWKFNNESGWRDNEWTGTKTRISAAPTPTSPVNSSPDFIEYKVTIKSFRIEGEHTFNAVAEPDKSDTYGGITIQVFEDFAGGSKAVPSLGNKSHIVWKRMREDAVAVVAKSCDGDTVGLFAACASGTHSPIPHKINASRTFMISRKSLLDSNRKVRVRVFANLKARAAVLIADHDYPSQEVEIYLEDIVANYGERHRPYERTILPVDWNGNADAKRAYVQYEIKRMN